MNPPDDLWTDDWLDIKQKVSKVIVHWPDIKAANKTKYYGKNLQWNIYNHAVSDPMMFANKMMGSTGLGYSDSTAVTTIASNQLPSITSTNPAGSTYTVMNFPVNGSTGFWESHIIAGGVPTRVFMTREGTKIVICEDGSYEIVAPENLNLVDYLKAHPNGKLLDRDGHLIEFNENGTLKWHLMRNVSGHVIDVLDADVKVRDSLLASSFGRIAVPNGGCRLVLPDGLEIAVDENGGYQLDDKKQTFTYKAAPRNFNRFLNASDVLEDFIRYLGSMAVRQRHVMDMPLGLFIQWLVIEAAKADGDPYEDVEPPLIEAVKAVKAQPRCQFCKRFISQARAQRGVNFCSPVHMERFLERENLDLPRLRPPRRNRIAAPPSDFLLPVPMAALGA